MADNKKSTALATTSASLGILAPEEISNIQRFIDSGFAEEKAFWIGDAKDGRVPVYFGQLVGKGEPIYLEKMGGTPNAQTGEIPTQEIPTYNFNPLDPNTFQPFTKRLDTIICNAMVANACAKYMKVAADKGGVAQILFRWNGKRPTRKGFQMNDVDTLFRIVDVRVVSDSPKLPLALKE
jgi:hypothetical protein